MKLTLKPKPTITFDPADTGLFMAAAHDTEFSTGRLAARLVEMYQANLEEDLKSVIEALDEEKAAEIHNRLEYLRGEIQAERISTGEIAELESLAEHIEPGDVELLQWANVPEFNEEEGK